MLSLGCIIHVKGIDCKMFLLLVKDVLSGKAVSAARKNSFVFSSNAASHAHRPVGQRA